MSRARVVLRRGGVVESTHLVSAALVDARGRLVAWAGEPDRIAFVRSAAKPFQTLAWVDAGVADAFGVTDVELALACGSHNGETAQVRAVARWLRRVGGRVRDLACGPHLPLHAPTARALLRRGRRPSRLHNNCSGKHTGMIAWARHAGWPVEGYHRADHPVQERVRRALARWSDTDAFPLAVDGCGVPTYALPLDRIALAFARLAVAARTEPGSAAGRVVAAMVRQPYYVAGRERLCTDLMEAAGGQLVAKVGAEGVYGVALLDRGEGLALKVEDGARRAVAPAVLAFLAQADRLGAGVLERLRGYQRPAVRNTRDDVVGVLEPEIDVRYA
jgi:L-asparaginase II